ncbi:MAG: hypothetical protein GXO32_05220 [Crenarchaeota archaeon]|nr:hypothetical protein [Thermoproteota archaeon]
MDGVMIAVDVVSISLVIWILSKLYVIEQRLARIEQFLADKLGAKIGEGDGS